MLQGTPGRVNGFYDHHPISEARVLAALARTRGAPGLLTADDLFEFDQDHYGGLAAVDTLARRAGIGATSRVLDVCAGLGGPARFLASRRGSTVVALELHAGRAAGAAAVTTAMRAALAAAEPMIFMTFSLLRTAQRAPLTRALAPARATSSSCWALEAPLTPIPPTTWPSTMMGIPPWRGVKSTAVMA